MAPVSLRRKRKDRLRDFDWTVMPSDRVLGSRFVSRRGGIEDNMSETRVNGSHKKKDAKYI